MLTTPIPRKRQAGLSLLEVLVSTLVLSAGLLGLASLQIAGMKTSHNSHQMQQATWLVNDLLEHMRANRSAALAGDYAGATDCLTAPDTLCTSGSCTPAQLAAYDLYRIRCGNPAGATSSETSVRNALLNGVLTVTCVDPDGAGALPADCNQGVTVNLQWNERNASRKGGDLDGSTDGLEAFSINLTAVL
ncbi:MAG TPA: type IV pilus modification protein PilV [Candidatus Thiothrix moscowensis]|uniref:type IV pilus modification protein PilV n=1 Tax=unclassified Thiothrix TaxID=2636184 RepID=UPI001A338D70|nr:MULTISPECIES: type IV pilus modification protein PilV [unclassified Thiothrix]MBJ6608958.1 type IV pilus modification protein PilV [Candidatus Thiothrix moscowensis]HRJ53299.1 type IV pilus modification protein PilV [Candidatus Thiothrix moscowensis]HRJ94138.1 type IV pilus modification protein PilV [Candidatus Thiothrix moscowensis]